MLIQCRRGYTESLLHRPDVGLGGWGWWVSVFSRVSYLSCCSERLHFKNATDKTDRIINHVSTKRTRNACTLILCSDVFWLCLFPGVINQCCVVRGSNMSWRGKQSSGTVWSTLCYALSLALAVTRGQIMLGDLVCVLVAGQSCLINVTQLTSLFSSPISLITKHCLHLPSILVPVCLMNQRN